MTPGFTTALSNYYPSHIGLKNLNRIAFYFSVSKLTLFQSLTNDENQFQVIIQVENTN